MLFLSFTKSDWLQKPNDSHFVTPTSVKWKLHRLVNVKIFKQKFFKACLSDYDFFDFFLIDHI